MEIQQAIIVIMLTAVICIFVAMVAMSMYPDKGEESVAGFNKLARTVLFGFVLLPWILIVCLTDLYMEQARMRHDLTENMSCN